MPGTRWLGFLLWVYRDFPASQALTCIFQTPLLFNQQVLGANLEAFTEQGQTAHLQAGLFRWCAPRPQIRTAQQGSIR